MNFEKLLGQEFLQVCPFVPLYVFAVLLTLFLPFQAVIFMFHMV